MSYGDDLRPPGRHPQRARRSAALAGAAEPALRAAAPVQSRRANALDARTAAGDAARSGGTRAVYPRPRVFAGPMSRAAPPAPAGQPMSIYAPGVAPARRHSRRRRAAARPRSRPIAPLIRAQQPAYNAPVYQPPPQRALPALGPMRGQRDHRGHAGGIDAASDARLSDGLGARPLGQRRRAAGGVALVRLAGRRDQADLGLFVPRDGRRRAPRICPSTPSATRSTSPASRSPTAARSRCKDGWHGSPEEQGFLHDVQLYACETFTTVLAPGYNVYHYNHIHVDLMRRESGRRPCRPDAIPGEVVAAKARAMYAAKQRGPAYTGSIAQGGQAAGRGAGRGWLCRG